jgi:putative hydrolase of the HAD superfamily
LPSRGVNLGGSSKREDLDTGAYFMREVQAFSVVVPDGTREVEREDWEMEGRGAPHVDHVTDDLAGFLAGLTTRSA